ncbi:MAG TPA: hypothetical protein VG326_05135 [Tepidisphaeraceae bacterium]|jgi:hypothetical protein|nr:hypothetical protein [Tepidisphaeraceae bacterium]
MTRLDLQSRAQSQPRVGYALLIGLIVLVAAGKPILFDTLDPDCFWHLRVAEQLRADGIGRLIDRLSFASMPRPWTPYSWLAELSMEWIWKACGWRAALIVQSLLQAAFIVFIAMACRAKAIPNRDAAADGFTTDPFVPGALESALATATAGVLSLAYMSFRPATAALTLLGFCGWLIVRDRRSGEQTKAVWILAPATALMANIHLYAILIPIWVCALWLGAIVERHGARPEHRAQANRRATRYGLLLAASTAASLATPMLPGVFASVLRYQFGDPMVASGYISEMRPFYDGVAGKISAALVVLFGAFVALGRHRLRVGEWLWLGVATMLLLRLGRFAPTFAIVAAPIFAAALPPLSGRILRKPAVCFLIASVLTIGVSRLWMQFPSRGARLATWLNRQGPDAPGYPCAAADYVAANVKPISGRLINEFTWGGYLEWRLGDQYQVLLDGRTQLFSPAFWQATYLGADDRRAWYFSRLQVDAAVLPIDRSLFQRTLVQQGWRTVYRDDRAQVLLPPPGVAEGSHARSPFAGLILDE